MLYLVLFQYDFDKVIMVAKENDVTVGAPYVAGAKVSASVLGEGKHKKVVVYKYKSKKGSSASHKKAVSVSCSIALIVLILNIDTAEQTKTDVTLKQKDLAQNVLMVKL